MYLRVYRRTYGGIKLAHKDRQTVPRGAYDEDYHYYLYDVMPNENYNCFKVTVAKNGVARKVLHEQITKAEYFKRKLDGTLKDGDVFKHDDV